MSTREEHLPTAGASLELTIDKYLQYIADRELRIGVEENKAAGGTAIIMNPQTGEILALANWPTFNPNDFAAVTADWRRNRAIQDIYEPGSTFKVVTASAAIEEGLIRTTDLIDCNPGYISFGPRKIYDTPPLRTPAVHRRHRQVEQRRRDQGRPALGADRLGVYINRFGFGQVARARLPRRELRHCLEPGAARPKRARVDVDGLSGRRHAAADGDRDQRRANGGELLEPHVVRAFIQNGHREEVPRKVVRRAISRGHGGDPDGNHGGGGRARHRQEAGRRGRLYRRGQDGDGFEARQRPVFQDRTTTPRSSASFRRASRR